MVALEDPHSFRPDRRRLWNQIACKLESSRESMQVPLANIERWLSQGRLHKSPLLQWRSRLQEAQQSDESMRNLLAFLRADNADSETLKSCSPFVGLLSQTELDELNQRPCISLDLMELDEGLLRKSFAAWQRVFGNQRA